MSVSADATNETDHYDIVDLHLPTDIAHDYSEAALLIHINSPMTLLCQPTQTQKLASTKFDTK